MEKIKRINSEELTDEQMVSIIKRITPRTSSTNEQVMAAGINVLSEVWQNMINKPKGKKREWIGTIVGLSPRQVQDYLTGEESNQPIEEAIAILLEYYKDLLEKLHVDIPVDDINLRNKIMAAKKLINNNPVEKNKNKKDDKNNEITVLEIKVLEDIWKLMRKKHIAPKGKKRDWVGFQMGISGRTVDTYLKNINGSENFPEKLEQKIDKLFEIYKEVNQENEDIYDLDIFKRDNGENENVFDPAINNVGKNFRSVKEKDETVNIVEEHCDTDVELEHTHSEFTEKNKDMSLKTNGASTQPQKKDLVISLKEKDNARNMYDASDFHGAKPSKELSPKTSLKYPTDPKIKDKAKKLAGYLCERCGKVPFFKTDGIPYSEGHHLVPMKYQAEFEPVSLDVVSNVICLCPNCHREIHHGSERKQIVNDFFLKRQYALKVEGIEITREKLYEYYNELESDEE